MFDLSWSELLVIGVVALIAIGPKELPGALRALGHWMGKIRRMAGEFQDQFREAMREAEVADLKKQVDEMADTARGYTSFDPLADIDKGWNDKDLDQTIGPHRNPASSASIPPPEGPKDETVPDAAPIPEPAVAAPEPVVAPAPPEPQAGEPKPGQGA